MSRKNIQKVLDLADPIDLKAGLTAYQDYQNILRSISTFYGVGFVQTVAAFVALSPASDYVGNLRSLVSVIQGVLAKKPVDEITVSTFKACRDRAHAYLKGDRCFLASTAGPKTISFYRNILDPTDPRFITIDGHMVGIYKGERLTMNEAARSKWNYKEIATQFKTVAKQNGLVPCQLQATLWFTWKRVNGVVYDAQLNLLDSSDPWKLKVKPEEIRPYG